MKLEDGHANARLDLVLRTLDTLNIGLELQFYEIALHRRPASPTAPYAQNITPEHFINNGMTADEKRIIEGNKRGVKNSAEVRGPPARKLAGEIRDVFKGQRQAHPDLTPSAFAQASLTRGWDAKRGQTASFSTIYRAAKAAHHFS